MGERLNLALIFGGKSAEHDISIRSANNIIKEVDQSKYNIILIGINKIGNWFLCVDQSRYIDGKETLSLDGFTEPVFLCLDGTRNVYNPSTNNYIQIDLAHPILHGPFGEDGSIQGLLKTASIPYVGPDVLSSAIGMDKEIMKRILRDNGIKVGPFITAHINGSRPLFEEVNEQLGIPMFVKPANMGSSIGINKVYNEQEFKLALADAFQYDKKIIIEANIIGREIECAVIGNESPKASILGEVLLSDDFYAYDTKYINDDGASVDIPAKKLSEEIVKKTQEIAIETYRALSCEGLSRVDVFIQEDGEIVVNEINTLPGFTSVSMFPSLWNETGMPYGELLEELYNLAFKRYERDQELY